MSLAGSLAGLMVAMKADLLAGSLVVSLVGSMVHMSAESLAVMMVRLTVGM